MDTALTSDTCGADSSRAHFVAQQIVLRALAVATSGAGEATALLGRYC